MRKILKISILGITVTSLLVLLFAYLTPGAQTQDNPRLYTPRNIPAYKPGEILVKFKSKVSKKKQKSMLKKIGSSNTIKTLGSKKKGIINHIKLKPSMTVGKAIKTLKASKTVIFAEPNYYYQALFVPNDTWYTTQWGLNNTGQLIWGYYGDADSDIDAPEGWDIEQGSTRSVVVAVIDSGIDFNHPDLDSKIWLNTDEAAANGRDDDGNGYVDDVNGYNWAGISQWSTTKELSLHETTTTPSDTKPDRIAQGIEGTGQTLTHVGFSIVKTVLRPLGDITVNVREGSPTGTVLSTMTIEEYEVDDVAASEVYKALNTPVTLANGSMYYLELVPTYDEHKYRYFSVGVYEEDASKEDEPYVEGDALVSTNDGVSYHAPISGTDTVDTDLFFRTNSNPYPHDDNQHGTHVSGIIASEPNNAQGVAGLSSGASIMPLKTFDSGGVYITNPLTKASDVAHAISYAANNGAKVINMSFGGSNNSATIQQTINDAYNSGVILFAAAGNSGDGTTNYPAANDNVIGVGATDNTDAKAYFSTYNSSVDVSAPGHAIISTVPTDLGITYSTAIGYEFFSGTSMASPMAAGVAALIKAKYPSYSPLQVELLLTRLSDDLGSAGRDNSFGYGRLNAQKALLDDSSAPSKPVVTSTSHAKRTKLYSNNDPAFSFSSTDNTKVAGYSFSLNRSSTSSPDKKKDSSTASKSYKNVANGKWYFHVRAVDNFGNWSKAAHYRINVDAYRPVTFASRSASVTKGGTVRLYYQVKDYFSGAKAKATIKIRKGNSVVKTIKLGWVPVNALRAHLFKANLSTGTYTFSIYATDKTGNTQSRVGSNTLKITQKVSPPSNGGDDEEETPVNPNPGLPWAP